MSYGDKVAAHPDHEEIVERLLSGESVRGVSDWLKSKYPSNKRRHISYLTLQRYRAEHLQLKGQVLKEVQATSAAVTTERVHSQRTAALRESEPYQAAKLQIATDVLNREQMILDLQDKVWQRIKMLENEDLNYKTETVLAQYIGELRQLMTDYHKMLVDWEKLEKKNGDQQVNVQVVMEQAEEQVSQVKIVVKEILQELDPELVPVFLDKLSSRIRATKQRQEKDSGATVNVQVNNYGS